MQSVKSCHMDSGHWGSLQKFSKYCIHSGALRHLRKQILLKGLGISKQELYNKLSKISILILKTIRREGF